MSKSFGRKEKEKEKKEKKKKSKPTFDDAQPQRAFDNVGGRMGVCWGYFVGHGLGCGGLFCGNEAHLTLELKQSGLLVGAQAIPPIAPLGR